MVITSVSITLLLSYVVLTGLSDMNHQIKKIVEKDVEREALALEIIAELSDMQRAEKNLIIATTQTDMGEHQKEFITAKEKILSASVKLKPLIHVTLQEKYQNFNESIDRYVGIFNQIAHLTRQNTNEVASNLLKTTVEGNMDKIDQLVEQIIVLKQKELNDELHSYDPSIALIQEKSHDFSKIKGIEISLLHSDLLLTETVISENEPKMLSLVEKGTLEFDNAFKLTRELQDNATNESKPLINNLLTQLKSFKQSRKEVIDLTLKNTNVKAFDLSEGKANSFADVARKNLNFIVSDSKADMIQAEIDSEEKYQSIRSMSLSVLITDILVSIILAALIIFQLTRSINKFKQKLLDIEKNKDLTQTYSVNGPAEIIIMDTSFNRLMKSLRELVDNVKQGSAENAATAQELSATSKNVGSNVELSVGIIDQTSHQASLINTEILSSIESAQSSKAEIMQANKTLQDARDEIIILTNRVQQAVETETRLSSDINRLSSEAIEIKSVLEVISNIAEQTNLLALNAAIEAARAGEQGRGFAVVADEVRNLAAHTQNSLNDINATITSIINSIEDVSKDMNVNTQDIQKLSIIANDVDAKINNTVLTVSKATEASDKTVLDFEHTGQEVGIIVTKILEVNKLSSENARSVEEIGSSAEFLNDMTEKLNLQLNVFKT